MQQRRQFDERRLSCQVDRARSRRLGDLHDESAEPLAETASVAAPLLRELSGAFAAEWLPRIAEGAVVVVLGAGGAAAVIGGHGATGVLVSDRGDLVPLAGLDPFLVR